MIFTLVNYVAYKKAKKVNASKVVTMVATILCGLAFVVLIVQQADVSLFNVAIPLGIILVCFLIEWIYKRNKRQKKNRSS